jgi:hypothetical protein
LSVASARLGEVLKELGAARSRLLASVAALSDGEMDVPPSADRWSIGEILHHLRLIEESVVRVIQKLVEKAEKSGVGPDPGDGSVLHSLDRFNIEAAVDRISAPASVAPTRGIPARDLREGLAGSRAALMKALDECSRFDMREILFPHPVVGRIDAYQWALFVAKHEERHRRQIETVKALRAERS